MTPETGTPLGGTPDAGTPVAGTQPIPGSRFGVPPDAWRAIVRQSLSISLAVAPFGFAFGASCVNAGIGLGTAMAFSTLVFSGGTQFAAVGVLGDGGSSAAAIIAGLLLAIRLFVYGLVMTPVVRGPFWFRAVSSHFMIDETVAVSSGQDPDHPRAPIVGYLVCGVTLFVFWNIATALGVVALSSAGSAIRTWGIDATIPASFAALLWPRLRDSVQQRVAALGALIAVVAIPLTPPGIPIVLAAFAALLALRNPVDAQVGAQVGAQVDAS